MFLIFFPSLFLGMFLHDYSYDPPPIHLLLLFLLLTVIFVINNYCSEEKMCVIYNTWWIICSQYTNRLINYCFCIIYILVSTCTCMVYNTGQSSFQVINLILFILYQCALVCLLVHATGIADWEHLLWCQIFDLSLIFQLAVLSLLLLGPSLCDH